MTRPCESHDDFIRALIAYVDANAGDERFARYHADVERETGERAPSFQVSLLRADDRLLVRTADAVGDTDLDAALQRLVEDSNELAPIATLDFVLQKNEDTWTHRGLVHTVAERRALDAARAHLDERLRSALARLPPPFGTVTLSRYRGSPVRFTGMFGLYDPEDIEPTREVLALLDAYEGFYASRAMQLTDIRVVWRSTTPDKLQLALVYGVPRDE